MLLVKSTHLGSKDVKDFKDICSKCQFECVWWRTQTLDLRMLMISRMLDVGSSKKDISILRMKVESWGVASLGPTPPLRMNILAALLIFHQIVFTSKTFPQKGQKKLRSRRPKLQNPKVCFWQLPKFGRLPSDGMIGWGECQSCHLSPYAQQLRTLMMTL